MKMIEKAENLNDNIKLIASYLDEEQQFDIELVKALENDKKSLEVMWEYIIEKARERLDSKSGAVHSSIVFNWAKEYFLTDKTNFELQYEEQRLKDEAYKKELARKKEVKSIEEKIKKNESVTFEEVQLLTDIQKKQKTKRVKEVNDCEQISLF